MLFGKINPSGAYDSAAKRKLGAQLIEEANREDAARQAALAALDGLAKSAADLKKLFS